MLSEKYLKSLEIIDISTLDSILTEYVKSSEISVGAGVEKLNVSDFLDNVFAKYAKLIPNRVVNIIVDLSVESKLYFLLIQEQKDIIKNQGETLSSGILDKMVFLDAFIKESLQQSYPASFIFRMAKKDVYLSSGHMIEKGSVASINAFSKLHKKGRMERNFDIRRHIISKRPFNESSLDNLVWGLGSTKCPLSKYAGTIIKVFIVLMIRKYYIFSDNEGNKPRFRGYNHFSTVVPRTKSVYLKAHDIKSYRDFIDLESEYNSLLNLKHKKLF
ncbi:hypothetical protein BB560_002596 [Smittium megazygosporum]|uniref:Cytochrome P450 n=1 Tax=Smittium megazygosporum TaxID=133381 RepID=A0A2T9ZEB4_9FUNG|nr:hypothetical protein BB560_002596 [Smittium megazygosporum]